MLRLTKMVWATLLSAALLVTGAMFKTSVAQKASVPRPQDSLALGEFQVRQLLLLMSTNKNGRISKREYMNFMEAEFDRLDKDKSGNLDVHELERSPLMSSNSGHAYVGK